MKTISWITGAGYFSDNTTDLIIPKPAGLATGDWLWLLCVNQNVTAMSATPSGFTNLWSATQTALATTIKTKWITDAGSEPADYTVTKASARGVGIAIAFRNVDPTTPFDVSSSTPGSNTNTGNPVWGAITPVTTGALIVGALGTYKSAGGEIDLLSTNGDQGILAEYGVATGGINPLMGMVGEVGAASTAFTFTTAMQTVAAATRSNTKVYALRPAPDDPATSEGKFFQFL